MALKWGVDWGPGYQFFTCISCETEWKERTRDCTSPSGSCCPKCGEFNHPRNYEMHLEWPVDEGKNLK